MKLSFLSLLLVTLALPGRAESLEDWLNQVPTFSPSGRNRHHMCSIAPGRGLLYGGRLGVGGALTDETYIYDVRTNIWTPLTPAISPPARQAGDLADIGDGRALLFGGTNGSLLNDTWRYDLGDSTWTSLGPVVSPSARKGHKMASIGEDRVVLFGGDDGSASDDTWIFDLRDSTWTEQDPAVKPSGRWDHDLASIGDGKVLLFGGADSSQFFADTWVYDSVGDTWIQLNPATGPSARYAHAMAHVGGDQVMLFGGRATVIYDDTWVFDLSGGEWTQDVNIIDPSARHYHTLSETSPDGSNYLVLFAGFFDVDDTWSFGGGDYIVYPPLAIDDLKATLAGSAIQLRWSDITADTRGNRLYFLSYEVFRGSTPDFEPSPGDSIGSVSEPFFFDMSPALGDTGTSHYYLVKVVGPGGLKSANSNRAGEFDRLLGNASQSAAVWLRNGK